MTKYEVLKHKAEKLKKSLELAIEYRDNLENNCIVSTKGYFNGQPFKPYLANRSSNSLGFIDADEFTEEEMDMLETLVRNHVENLRTKYDEAAVKLQAVEELLS